MTRPDHARNLCMTVRQLLWDEVLLCETGSPREVALCLAVEKIAGVMSSIDSLPKGEG
jgi:hypothetical protein